MCYWRVGGLRVGEWNKNDFFFRGYEIFLSSGGDGVDVGIGELGLVLVFGIVECYFSVDGSVCFWGRG